MIDLEKLKELAAKASPGNWKAEPCGSENCWCRIVTTDANIEQGSVISSGSIFAHDAEYVAALSPSVASELIAEVERLRRENGELREALGAALGWVDAVPSDTPLPAMPGFDRDWVNGLLDKEPNHG